jgi:hypothetical protein
MSKLTTILGSVALLVASNAVVKGDDLLAGPLPLDVGTGTGTVTCSATNAILAGQPIAENIQLVIFDASAAEIAFIQCSGELEVQSCSTSVTFGPNSTPVPPSPFVCRIDSASPDVPAAPVRGSICGTVNNATGFSPGSTYCLQALLDNGHSGGWTPSGGP